MSRPRSIGLLSALFVMALLPGIAVAQRHGPDRRPAQNVSVRGIVTAVEASTSTLRLALFEIETAAVRVASNAIIEKGGQRVALTALAAGDFVEVQVDRRTRLATRVEVNAAPTVTIAGYLTALDGTAGTLQVTTGRGTSITLKTTANSRIRLQGRTTTLAGLAVGELVQARYALADKSATDVEVQVPRVLIGTLAGIDLTARTVQYTTLGGTTNTVNLAPGTLLRLNGRLVTPTSLAPGFEVRIALNLANNSALEVDALTPALLDLSGTVTSLDGTAGTVQVGTPFGTAITFRTTVTTTISLNNAAAPLTSLAPGDRVQVSYQLALPPGASTALRITATR